MKIERQTDIQVKSYHTFMFPFVWEHDGMSFERISKSFQTEGEQYWICDDLKEEWTLEGSRGAVPNERRLFYAEYQYFYPAVRSSLYGAGEPAVMHRFTFCPPKQDRSYNRKSGMDYVIEHGGRTYTLSLNNIRLRLYNTGIGILLFECENHEYHTLAEIKAINEYGRRVGIASVPVFANADRLGVRISGLKNEGFFTSFEAYKPQTDEQTAQEQAGKIGRADGLPLTYFASFITDILNLGRTGHRFVSGPSTKAGDIFIYPAIDDRMYVHCVIDMTNEGAAEITEYFQDPEHGRAETEKSIYELFFIDLEGECSCQSKKMRREELENSAYLRWLDRQSVYAVTHHSMLMLSQSPPPHLVNAFLTEYMEISILGLAQKASLISLQAKMARISRGLEIDGNRVDNGKINALADLQERFVAFSNQLDFHSVTEQYQGEELYDKLRGQLYIMEARESLHQQIESLYETANVNQDFNFNMYALIFALISMIWALASVCNDGVSIWQIARDGAWWAFIVIAGAVAIAVAIYCVTKKMFKRQHGVKDGRGAKRKEDRKDRR